MHLKRIKVERVVITWARDDEEARKKANAFLERGDYVPTSSGPRIYGGQRRHKIIAEREAR